MGHCSHIPSINDFIYSEYNIFEALQNRPLIYTPIHKLTFNFSSTIKHTLESWSRCLLKPPVPPIEWARFHQESPQQRRTHHSCVSKGDWWEIMWMEDMQLTCTLLWSHPTLWPLLFNLMRIRKVSEWMRYHFVLVFSHSRSSQIFFVVLLFQSYLSSICWRSCYPLHPTLANSVHCKLTTIKHLKNITLN